MENIIINFTPTGMIPMKKDTPYVPVTPSEIIDDVRQAVALGITMVHLHARETESGEPTYKKEIYAEIIRGIREFAPELIICVSTSGRLVNTFEARSEVLSLDGDLKPDMASLTLSSLNFNRTASVNTPDMISNLAQKMKDRKILPELEVFDLGMTNTIHYLLRKGLLPEMNYVNFIVGNIASAQADLMHLGVMIKDLPQNTLFSLGAVGDRQLQVNSLAIAMGYGIRVGLEDNFWYDEERTQKATNLQLLERVHRIIRANGNTVMKSSVLRKCLNLKQGQGEYGLQ